MKEFKEKRMKIIKIQTKVRQFLAKRKYKKMKASDLIIQKLKGHLQFKKFKKDKELYIKI